MTATVPEVDVDCDEDFHGVFIVHWVAMALATGWDFLGKTPVKLQRPAAHVFWVTADGCLELRTANLPLGEPVP